MNRILLEIKKVMLDSVKEYLPQIHLSDLEDNGAVYYMNGKNGTEFDWYVNEKVSDFMMFYNDEANMGAVKTTLYNDGGLLIYVYGEQGKAVPQKIESYLDVTEEEILSLAVLLRNEADDKSIWDADIERMDTDKEADAAMVKEFVSNAHDYDDMRERKTLLGQVAYVSKRIMDEGWKIGYMYRDEVVQENDSGWVFMAGNEDDEYTEDYRNIQLMSIHSVMQYDGAIWKHITAPVGTRLIRVSAEEFEVDDNTKEIYMEKIR
ncbi:MAG: DUF2185 domain-containing protein [Lachnospiraceae bacterium]|nr:DUF2185 domain-containing protein [Lachnospiraceae bacterium]